MTFPRRPHESFLQPTRPPSPTFVDNRDTVPPSTTPRPTFTSPPFPRSPPPAPPPSARPFMNIPLEETYPTNPTPGSIPRPVSRFSTYSPPLDPLITSGPRIPEDIYPDPTLQAADRAALGRDIARNPGIPMPVPESGPISAPIPTVGQAGRGLAADETLPPPPLLSRPNNSGRSSLKKTVSFQGETRHLTRPRQEEDDRGEGEAGAEPGARDIQ